MTIYASSRSMTSSVTSEWACVVPGRQQPEWQLSWLPARLTRGQALAGMELLEMLSHPDIAADPAARARADQLGITVQQALSRLHQRMLDRRHS